MSSWLHVAGIIRIDAVRFKEENVEEATKMFEGFFGKELCFDSGSAMWDEACEHPERFLPLGSEGSLTMSVWVNPDIVSLASYTVSIFGDLRDCDDPEVIIDWFKKKCKSDEIWVRNACVTVVNNNSYGRNWSYTDD